MACGFTVVVMPVLGKFNRKAMIGTAVLTGQKAFNNLAGNKIQLQVLPPLLYICKILNGKPDLASVIRNSGCFQFFAPEHP